jgi:hypothetical protein
MSSASNVAGSPRSADRVSKHGDEAGRVPLRAFATWAVVLVLAAASIAALGLHLWLFYRDPALFRTLVAEHVQALVGIPLAAASAFCILLVFEARAGHVELEALGIRFRGGAGPAVIWIFAFLSIVAAIRLLW